MAKLSSSNSIHDEHQRAGEKSDPRNHERARGREPMHDAMTTCHHHKTNAQQRNEHGNLDAPRIGKQQAGHECQGDGAQQKMRHSIQGDRAFLQCQQIAREQCAEQATQQNAEWHRTGLKPVLIRP
jgi:hypothetical protein